MSYRFWVDPRAEIEMADAAAAYEATRPGYGTLFLSDIDHAVMLLLAAPNLYQRVDGPIRRAVLRRFPYNLYYRVNESDRVIQLVGCTPGRVEPTATLASLAARIG